MVGFQKLKSSSTSPSFTVFFRVKFYVENVTHLKLPQTRHQYYLQLRKDLLEGKMCCPDKTALKLAALALQAEKGDYDIHKNPRDYFRAEDYLSQKVTVKLSHQYILDCLPNLHEEQHGQPREAAELEFLKEAQKLPEYGTVFYRVAKDKHGAEGEVLLGFCVRGIMVYSVHVDERTLLHYCPWQKTCDISRADCKFIIEMQDSKPLTFYTSSYKSAKYLLHLSKSLSKSYHRFQLTTRGLVSRELKDLDGDGKLDGGTELRDLVNELQGVTDWFHLGLCLGLRESKLQEIKQDYRMNDECRREMLITWKCEEIEPTWPKVLNALVEMGTHVHALYIAAKHGLALPRSVEGMLFKGRQDQDVQSHLGDEEQVLVTNAPKPKLGLRELLKELRPVTAWYNLGLHLDIPEPRLKDIQESNSGNTDDSKREMLMAWLELEVPTWRRVIRALIHIGLPVLAVEIAHNHDALIPKSVFEKTQPEQGAQVGTGATPQQTSVEHPDVQLKEVPMTDLLTELQKVTDWFTLGVFLEIPTPVLKAIVKDWDDSEQCKLEMLIAWSKQETPTWPRVMSALGEMGMAELALAIAHKYGVRVPSSLSEALERKTESARGQAMQAGKHHQNVTGDGCPKELTIPEYQEGDMSLKQLVDVLQEVVEWIPFGLYLGLAIATLKQLQKNHQTTALCKQEMLYTWMKERTPTWLKVVQALVHIKMFRLAVKIGSKYRVTVPALLYKEMKGAMDPGELQRYRLKVEQRRNELDDMAEQQDASIGGAKLKDLDNELQSVMNWFRLGLCLRVPKSVLMSIQRDVRTISTRRKEMLIAWMKRENPTWSTLVKALLDMGMPDLAMEITSKHLGGGSSLQQQHLAMRSKIQAVQQETPAKDSEIQVLRHERQARCSIIQALQWETVVYVLTCYLLVLLVLACVGTNMLPLLRVIFSHIVFVVI